MELKCAIQNYAWGVKGPSSSIAKFISSSIEQVIDDEVPYAELWMGTHPNGPGSIKESDQLLSSYLNEYPDTLGANIISKFGYQLCYLFKVLSVNQALSIQAHPNKSHAEQLHKERPLIYKDPNHKPEMAIAITSFQALCGFRTSEELKYFLNELPELKAVVGEETANNFIFNSTEENLKQCFSALINADKTLLGTKLIEMKDRISDLDEATSAIFMRDTFVTLNNQYPGDGGCFSIYFLNLITLKPGEALFLGPNIIHAYLLGDCIECMACSDNVVRAGLTPKFQDVETLLAMLEYTMSSGESRKFVGQKIDENVTLFDPPVPDFAVQKIQASNGEDFSLSVEDSASILIVIEGTACDVSVQPPSKGGVTAPQIIKMGTVVFTEANQSMSFKVDSSHFLAFRALCL